MTKSQKKVYNILKKMEQPARASSIAHHIYPYGTAREIRLANMSVGKLLNKLQRMGHVFEKEDGWISYD